MNYNRILLYNVRQCFYLQCLRVQTTLTWRLLAGVSARLSRLARLSAQCKQALNTSISCTLSRSMRSTRHSVSLEISKKASEWNTFFDWRSITCHHQHTIHSHDESTRSASCSSKHVNQCWAFNSKKNTPYHVHIFLDVLCDAELLLYACQFTITSSI